MGRVIAGLFASCIALSMMPAALAAIDVYVSNYYGGSIHVYPLSKNGDLPPSRTIVSGLSLPHDLAIDLVNQELFVPNNRPASQAPAVNVYALNAGSPGVGDAPKRTITGPATLLDRPAGLIVDSVHREIYVANDVDAGAILVFPLDADGNVAPTRVLQGLLTGLRGPMGLALNLVHNELIVVSYKVADEGSISTFSRTAQGNVAPLRTIQGPLTTFNKPQALALDLTHNELIVANSYFDNQQSLGALLVFSRTASGNVAPIRQITGSNTGLCNPIGMTFDRVHDQLLVTNAAANPACQPSVVVFPRSAGGNVVPLRKIGPGPECDLNNPEGIAVVTVDCADPLVAPGTECDDGNSCTTGDACGNNVCNSGTTITAPPEVANVTALFDRETFSWTAQAESVHYDVVRGSLGALGVGPGGGEEFCFNNITDFMIADGDVPDLGEGFWYAVRGDNACGHGTYGTQTSGSPRLTTTCP